MQKVLKNGGFDAVYQYGPAAVRSIEALLRELKTTARRGFGLALNEAEPGVAAVAAAIRSGKDGAALGTVSVAGPTVRMTDARVHELAPLVVQCAAELASLWPLRSRSGPNFSVKDVVEAA